MLKRRKDCRQELTEQTCFAQSYASQAFGSLRCEPVLLPRILHISQPSLTQHVSALHRPLCGPHFPSQLPDQCELMGNTRCSVGAQSKVARDRPSGCLLRVLRLDPSLASGLTYETTQGG